MDKEASVAELQIFGAVLEQSDEFGKAVLSLVELGIKEGLNPIAAIVGCIRSSIAVMAVVADSEGFSDEECESRYKDTVDAIFEMMLQKAQPEELAAA